MKPPLRMATIAITTAMVGSVSVLLLRPLFLRMEEVAVAEVRPDRWRYPNEQSWIVGETLGHVAGLAHFARTGTVAPSQSIDFAVRDRAGADGRRNVFEVSRRDGTGEHEELRVEDSVLSPPSFWPLAVRWLNGTRSSGAASSTSPLAELTDLRLEKLFATAQQVSNSLTTDPRSSVAHEDAAFVLAAFALRESAAGHTDPRRILMRANAHLVLADALRSDAPDSTSGRLARIALLCLSGRTAEAFERLETLAPPADTAEEAWTRALRLFVTHDWRQVPWSGDLTLVEQLAWFRAVKTGRNSDRAYVWLDELDVDRRGLPDWGRMRLTGYHTVRDCHEFAIGGAEQDVAEAWHAAQLFEKTVSDRNELVVALNAAPALDPVGTVEGQPRIEVLDWGTVAAFIQRHLGARLSYEAACYETTFGLPQQTLQVVRAQESEFGGLDLFPLEAQRWTKTSEGYGRYADAARSLIRENPQLVTAHLWNRLLETPVFAKSPEVPDPKVWFNPPYPFGTVLPDSERLYGPHYVRHPSIDEYDALIRLNPFDARMRWARAKARHGDPPPYEAMRNEFGPSLEWDLYSMNDLAWLPTTPPEERRRWLARVCELDADYCVGFAYFLGEAGDDGAAAEAYRRLWQEGLDRVQVANNMGWLVEYDRKRGNLKEAWEVANDAAATHSARGLTVLADLAEKTNRRLQAESTFATIAERYARLDVLYEFYARQVQAGHTGFAAKRDAVFARVFPNGFESVASLTASPPADGVLLRSVERDGQREGLRYGDIVVALDGIRTHSPTQLRIVALRGTDPKMQLAVFRRGVYLEIVCEFKDRHLPAEAVSYPQER